MRKLYLRAPVRARALPHGRPNAASLRLIMMKRLGVASLPHSAAAVVVGHSLQPSLTTEAAHGPVGGSSDLLLVRWRVVQQRWLQTAHAGVCRGEHATSACGRWWYVRPGLWGRKEHVFRSSYTLSEGDVNSMSRISWFGVPHIHMCMCVATLGVVITIVTNQDRSCKGLEFACRVSGVRLEAREQ